MNKEKKRRQIFSLENIGNKLMYKSDLEIISVSTGTTCPEHPFCTVKQLPFKTTLSKIPTEKSQPTANQSAYSEISPGI